MVVEENPDRPLRLGLKITRAERWKAAEENARADPKGRALSVREENPVLSPQFLPRAEESRRLRRHFLYSAPGRMAGEGNSDTAAPATLRRLRPHFGSFGAPPALRFTFPPAHPAQPASSLLSTYAKKACVHLDSSSLALQSAAPYPGVHRGKGRRAQAPKRQTLRLFLPPLGF